MRPTAMSTRESKSAQTEKRNAARRTATFGSIRIGPAQALQLHLRFRRTLLART